MLHLGLVSSFWRMNIRDGYWSICLFYPHLSLYRDTFSISTLYGFQRAHEILYGWKSGDLVGSSGDLSGKRGILAHILFTWVQWVLWMTAGGLVETLGMVGRKSVPLDTPAIAKVVYLFSLFSMVQLIMQCSLKTLQVRTVFPFNKPVSHFHLFSSISCAHPTNTDRCAQNTHHMPTTHVFCFVFLLSIRKIQVRLYLWNITAQNQFRINMTLMKALEFCIFPAGFRKKWNQYSQV